MFEYIVNKDKKTVVCLFKDEPGEGGGGPRQEAFHIIKKRVVKNSNWDGKTNFTINPAEALCLFYFNAIMGKMPRSFFGKATGEAEDFSNAESLEKLKKIAKYSCLSKFYKKLDSIIENSYNYGEAFHKIDIDIMDACDYGQYRNLSDIYLTIDSLNLEGENDNV